MPVARVNGVRLNHVQLGADAGPREDLVLVHGLATNMAFWYFQHAPVFARRYRVTMYDLRGHGRSERPAGGYAPRNLARDLEGLLDHLGIARAHFLAHSYGGVVTLNLACVAPERIASLVLADTHISAARREGAGLAWAHGVEIQKTLDETGVALDTRDPYFGYRLLTAVARFQLRNEPVPPALAELVGPLMASCGTRTAAQWLALMDTADAERELMGDDGLSREALRALRFPILAMYGDNSQARLTGEELLDLWPEAEFRRVRDAGHFFPTTRAAELIQCCDRFWSGDFGRGRAQRASDGARRYFRSDRIYQAGPDWYCRMRGEPRLGPFASEDEANRQLIAYIARIREASAVA